MIILTLASKSDTMDLERDVRGGARRYLNGVSFTAAAIPFVAGILITRV